MSWRRKPRNVRIMLSRFVDGSLTLLDAADKKRVEVGRGHNSDDSDSRPKKKAPAKSNGKKGKR